MAFGAAPPPEAVGTIAEFLKNVKLIRVGWMLTTSTYYVQPPSGEIWGVAVFGDANQVTVIGHTDGGAYSTTSIPRTMLLAPFIPFTNSRYLRLYNTSTTVRPYPVLVVVKIA